MADLHSRRMRAQNLLRDADLGAALFVPGPNFTYLTDVHLHLMERPTLFALTDDGGMAAVMPALEREKWSTAMPQAETFYWDDADGPAAAFANLAAALGTDRVLGVEGLRMRAAEYIALGQHWPDAHLKDGDNALVGLRLHKDEDEIADLRRAIAISEAALGDVLDGGIGGRTEAEIATRLRAAMLSHGATGFAFDAIVLTGGAAANPHGDVSDRIVAPGNPLLIDFGASYGDMHADITRTFFCDHVRDDHAAIYETVQAANVAGCAAAAPGVPAGDVDVATSDVLKASPFGDLILHKTGHGLGREVHEAPQIMRPNRMPLAAGMIITIEPGLYRTDDVGVRIEDDVLITDDGHESLTQFPRALQTVA